MFNKIILIINSLKSMKKNKNFNLKKIYMSLFKAKNTEKGRRLKSKFEKKNFKVSIEKQTKICLNQ